MKKIMIAVVLLAVGVGCVLSASTFSRRSCTEMTEKELRKLDADSYEFEGRSFKQEWCECMDEITPTDDSSALQMEILMCGSKLGANVKHAKNYTEIRNWEDCIDRSNCTLKGQIMVTLSPSPPIYTNNSPTVDANPPSSTTEVTSNDLISAPNTNSSLPVNTSWNPSSEESSSPDRVTTSATVSGQEVSDKPTPSSISTEKSFENFSVQTVHPDNQSQSASNHLYWSIPLICILLVAMGVGGYFIHRRTKKSGYVQSSSNKSNNDSVKKITDDV